MKRIIILIGLLLIIFNGFSQQEPYTRPQLDSIVKNSNEYHYRVVADGGFVNSDPITKGYMLMCEDNSMQESIEFCYLGESGGQYRSTSNYYNVEKIYDFYGTNDGTQTTEASQPYLTGNIAPVEHWGIKNPYGDSRSITIPTITVSGTYTITKAELTDTGKIVISHTELTSGSISTITPNNTIYAYIIRSQALSAQQIAAEAAFLQTIYPEIPTTKIGEQEWATSNCEMVATPMGSVIANVTDNTEWASSQTLYDNYLIANPGDTYGATKAAAMWCHYNNDSQLGAIYGKLYNWFAVSLIQQDIDLYNAANPTTQWGYHVPSSTEFNTLTTYLGGTSVAGGKMKKEGLDYWDSPNTAADNSSGFSSLGCGRRTEDGIYSQLKSTHLFLTITNSGINATVYYNLSGLPSLLSGNVLKSRGYSLRLIKD